MADTPAPKYETRSEAIAALTGPGQTYELEQTTIRGRSLRVFKNAPASLRELYSTAVSDKTFIVYESERLTFAQAWTEAGRIGALLIADYGVRPGDRVAISMRNYPEWILAFMAVTSIGGIVVAMNALWQPEEMAYGLSDCGAKVLFADQERLDRLALIDTHPNVKVISVRATTSLVEATDLKTRLAAFGPADMPNVGIAPDDEAMIFYTSGSTGHPKGVLSTHRNVLSALLSWELDLLAGAEQAGITPEPPVVQPAGLLAVPLFHVTGANAIFLQAYRAQRKLVCMYRWDPEKAAELIEVEKISSVTAPAAMTGDLVRVAKQTSRNLDSLLAVGGGGAARAPEQVKQIEASFGKALPSTGWGMTETNAIGTGIGGLDYLGRPASSGRCSAVLDLKVIDEQGNTLSAGERGELLVRGTSVFFGYWNRPGVNANLFDDGWFRTGDVAYLDDEGFLFIVDRIKDLIIRGGENIGCGTVEAALLRYPDVHEAAVYAVPDDRLGEEVGATVHGNPGMDLDALRTFLEANLARFEVPRYILISDEPLPRTASGKILKRDLRERAVAELAKENT